MCNPTFFLSGGIRLEGKYGREENAFRKSSARRSCSCLSAEKNKPYYDSLHAVITFYADLIFFVEVRLWNPLLFLQRETRTTVGAVIPGPARSRVGRQLQHCPRHARRDGAGTRDSAPVPKGTAHRIPGRHWRQRRPAGGWSPPAGAGGRPRGAPLRTDTRSRKETAASGTPPRSAPPPSRPRTAPSAFPPPSLGGRARTAGGARTEAVEAAARPHGGNSGAGRPPELRPSSAPTPPRASLELPAELRPNSPTSSAWTSPGAPPQLPPSFSRRAGDLISCRAPPQLTPPVR